MRSLSARAITYCVWSWYSVDVKNTSLQLKSARKNHLDRTTGTPFDSLLGQAWVAECNVHLFVRAVSHAVNLLQLLFWVKLLSLSRLNTVLSLTLLKTISNIFFYLVLTLQTYSLRSQMTSLVNIASGVNFSVLYQVHSGVANKACGIFRGYRVTVYCVFTISVAVCGMLEIRYRLLRPLIETNSVSWSVEACTIFGKTCRPWICSQLRF